jgi:hypothetical protein
MRQIEITVRVKEPLDKAIIKLEKLGFKNIRESNVDDVYMTQLKDKLNKENIQYILSNSVLLRYLNVNGKEFKKISYKNKIYENGNVISEKKVNVECNSLESAKQLFECLNFEELVEVKYNVLVMEKNGIELAFQYGDDIGVLIEYENKNDFSNKTNEEIRLEKENMYNYIKELGIEITEEIDVKKAWELIEKSI